MDGYRFLLFRRRLGMKENQTDFSVSGGNLFERRNSCQKGARMYTIEFYENEKGKSDIIEYIRLLHEGHRDDYYKMAAFLDLLAEWGSGTDKMVCRCPEGIIYMHYIEGMTKLLPESSADPWYARVGRTVFSGKRRFLSSAAHREKAVCVILYGWYSREERSREAFVILHHYFTNRVTGGIPLLQMFRAVHRLRKMHRYRSER